MSPKHATADEYGGFEQGPIRPPSEARSLLVRVTRNCPWNRCLFCPVYKGEKFSRRPVEHVLEDIDAVYRHVEVLRRMTESGDRVQRSEIRRQAGSLPAADAPAFAAAFNWFFAGRMESVFLQDADALSAVPKDLVKILTHLRQRFPDIERITTYSRTHTLALKKDEDLAAMSAAGLNRVHVGLESGCDEVLEMVKKGATKEKHVTAGLKVKRAGMELSEYVMPGLGGRALSERHALDTADVLNQINPDFIRIRTLAIPSHTPLIEEYRSGRFQRCTEVMVVRELQRFIGRLQGITSVVKSDHILNLFGDLEGTLPDDQERMLKLLQVYLEMDADEQRLYQVGRRLGIFHGTGDLEDLQRRGAAEEAYASLGVTADNVEEITDRILAGYI